MGLNRAKSIQSVKAAMHRLESKTRVFHSDGDIDDGGAFKGLGELCTLLEVLESGATSENVSKEANWTGNEELLSWSE